MKLCCAAVTMIALFAVGGARAQRADSEAASAARSAVRSTVDSAVRSAVDSAVRSVVDSVVNSVVDSVVRSAIRSAASSAVLVTAGEASRSAYVSGSKCGAKSENETSADCAKNCVKQDAEHFSVNNIDKRACAIDGQDKVAARAGHEVVVEGSVDGKTPKLHTIDIAPKKSTSRRFE